MQQLHILKTLSVSLLLLATLPVVAQTARLDSLPQESQEQISRVCLPVQFREGAGAYRNCVQAELELRTNGGANEMAKLSFDDKYAVQQACAKAGGQSSSAYQSCVSDQINALRAISTPSFDNVSEDELYVVQQTCFDAQSKQGAASYRQCLNAEIKSLSAVAAADTSQLNMLNKNALQLRCSANATTAAQYRECIGVEFESIAGTAPTFLPVSTATQVVRDTATTTPQRASVVNDTVAKVAEQASVAPTTSTTMALPRNINPQRADTTKVLAATETPQISSENTSTLNDTTQTDAIGNEPATATSQARVISRPDLVKTLELQQRAAAQGIELEESAPVKAATDAAETAGASATVKMGDLWQKFLNALASLDSMGWLILAGVLALPALLLGLFSMMRRFKQPANDVPVNNAALTERIEPGMHTRMLRHEREAAELFGEPVNAAPLPTNDTVQPEHDAVTRMATKSDRTATSSASSNHAWQSAFGHWLTKQPDSDKLHLCIEFLIYWVAYGDERYEPGLKKRLFTANDLNTHDQIKRWVLKQDVFAFSDVVGWLRTNATQEQQEQCIALIMALLVTENGVTPVQNTLIRFLSDAFNIGKLEMENRFEQAFGHIMPAIPRPDKKAWWAKQHHESMLHWDSRALALRPEREQMIARLGLSAGFDESDVINAFRRAARRCHPDRFTALGERERALAAQRFAKYEQARDKLLGVSV